MMDDDPDGVRRRTMTQTRNDASGSEPKTIGQRFRKVLRPLPKPINPALLEHERQRAEERQNRIADGITAFSGSMLFVYIHVVWFACWIGFGAEHYPYGLLTMIVSLEAIFLSTFVMISQNRADAKRQVIADEQWRTVREERKQNVELLKISNQILALTQEVRGMASAFRDQDEIAALTKEVRALKSSRARPSE
jgi:uncharacterized membrane protein